MKRQMAEISSNVISHIKSAHPIEMWRSNKLGIKEKISRGNFPRLIFSCPVPSGLPHRSHCVPMNMNRSVAVFSVMMVFEKFVSIRPRFVSFNRQIPPPFAALLVLITVLVTARWFAVRSLLYKRVLNLYLGRIIQICQQDSAANRLVFPTIGRVVFDLYRIFFGAIDNQPRCGSSLPNCYERIYHFSSLFLGEMA